MGKGVTAFSKDIIAHMALTKAQALQKAGYIDFNYNRLPAQSKLHEACIEQVNAIPPDQLVTVFVVTKTNVAAILFAIVFLGASFLVFSTFALWKMRDIYKVMNKPILQAEHLRGLTITADGQAYTKNQTQIDSCFSPGL